MIPDNQVILIEKVKYISDYKLELLFNDKVLHVIDFYPFL